MSVLAKLRPIVVQPLGKHTASLIFLHGSGDTGPGIREWFMTLLDEDLSFPHVKVIYPTAVPRPYTPSQGMISNVWFDRAVISPAGEEDDKSRKESSDLIDELIQLEVNNGIPRSRILLGGYSMGGGLTLLHGLRQATDLAGLIVISSFLGNNSSLYEYLGTHKGRTPPLLQMHGARDQLVFEKWGRSTNDKLKALGVQTDYFVEDNLRHEINAAELERLRDFVMRCAPPLDSPSAL